MNLEQMKQTLDSKDYEFLKKNPHLGKNIFLIGLGGSYAYGMEKEDSDLDLRGIAFNSKREILLGEDFGQVTEIEKTDTTIYSFHKILKLIASNNPNTVEMLGLKPEHYLYITDIGRELLANQKMFLSKICIHTFAGYAVAQLRRLENKLARLTSQSKQEAHILNSIQNAEYDFKRRYFPHNNDAIRLYIDTAVQEGYQTEIFMDINLTHYPLRDWAGMWNEMKAIVGSYAKIGKRNEKAIEHNKLGKHMAHLIRLYMMCIDILEKEKVITYRIEEQELLMSIRNGEYLDEYRQPREEFYELLREYEKRFEYAKKHTCLPDVPDYEKINEFKMYVNEKIVKGEII